MIIVYILAVMWSLGCTCIPLWISSNCIMDPYDRSLGVVILLIGFPLGCILACLPWAFLADMDSPDLALLKKNAWFCSNGHNEVYTSTSMAGKVPVASSHNRYVCDQYNRK